MIYHIVSKSDWQATELAETYRGDTLINEGFIHCSTIEQVVDTANVWFKGRTDLLLLTIDPAKLTAPLKYEDGGDGRLFPHVYGPIEKEAIIDVVAFPLPPDGRFVLPK